MKIESGSNLRVTREALGLSQAKLAEITGIPQHLLSALELEKSAPDQIILNKIADALSDIKTLNFVTKRKKRYQAHTYERTLFDPTRADRHAPTSGNHEYVKLLTDLHAAQKQEKYTALSLFAGCGGMSLGFRWAGFKIKGFVEIDPGLRTIYRANFPESIELGGDIAAVTDADIGIGRQKIGEIDILIGGPPCQGFSLSGKRSVSDPRNTLFLDYLRFLDVYQPKVAVMENVRLLTSMKSPGGGLVKDEIRREFAARGYRVAAFEINARSYGVPQHRERIFFVAIRTDLDREPSLPIPTHSSKRGDLFQQAAPFRTFADACSDLAFIESGESSTDPLHVAVSHPNHVIKWLWDVAEGRSAHENEDPSMRPPSGYNTTYKRQVWLEEAATVQTTFGMISGCRNVHPIATRSLTVREAARIQSFPDKFDFGRALGVSRTGIGNAVPPLLAYRIANHIISEFL